jgi:hypothetical protein
MNPRRGLAHTQLRPDEALAELFAGQPAVSVGPPNRGWFSGTEGQNVTQRKDAGVMRIITLVLLSSALSFAGTWSGTLVDARCWGFSENNVGQKNTMSYVGRDRNLQVSQCSPKTKTKSFAVLTPEGHALTLDASGNATASSELAKVAHRKSPIRVVVTGEPNNKNSIQVSSISAAK